MYCVKCDAANPDGKKFCGDCGVPFVARQDAKVADQPGVYFCHRHHKETTRVRCGRCEKPVCTRCAVPAPVGIKCRECAKSRVPIRPRGVAHAAGQHMDSPAGRTVWYLALWAIIVSAFSNLFGGGGDS